MLREAARQVRTKRHVWVILYFASLFSGLLLILLPASQLLDAASFTAIRDAADGADLYHLVELFRSAAIFETLGSDVITDTTTRITATLLGVIGGALVLSFLLSAFLRGGALGVLHGQDGGFGRNGRRYFFSFVFLQLLHAFLIITLFAFVAACISLVSGLDLASQSGVNSIAALGGLVWLLYLIWFEMASATLIVHNIRNPFQAFWRGMRQFFQQPWRVLGFFLFALLLMVGVQSLFRFAIHPALPARWWPLVLVVQQISIILRIGLRLFRYAGILRFITPPPMLATLPEPTV